MTIVIDFLQQSILRSRKRIFIILILFYFLFMKENAKEQTFCSETYFNLLNEYRTF